jgi:hypothetical protein
LEENKDNLIFQVIFLRLTPFLPNWLINSGSPIIGLKFHTFFLGTFIGFFQFFELRFDACQYYSYLHWFHDLKYGKNRT